MSAQAHETDPNEPQRAGERLAAGRERLGLTQAKVAEQLRLATGVVAALEAGDYKQIGARVFVRGYLRRYAELIGESPESFAGASLQHSWAEQTPELTSTRLRALAGTSDRRAIGPWPVLLVALLLCIVGVVWWAQRAAAPRAARARDQSVVQQEVVVAPPTLGGAAAPGSPPVGATAPPADKPVLAAPAAALAAAPASVPAAPVPAAPLPKAPVASPAAKLAAAPGGRRQLRLSFGGESWAEVYDAEGTRLYWDLGQGGQSRSMSGVPPFKIIIGNPALVSMSYEGRALTLPPPRTGTTLHATLDGNGALAAGR